MEGESQKTAKKEKVSLTNIEFTETLVFGVPNDALVVTPRIHTRVLDYQNTLRTFIENSVVR